MPHEHYTIGCYLLDRLYEIGCHDMFGVPGDFNLRFLDDVMTHKMKWIGCANELNAAYAADGYGRVRGVACLLTTCGVGELSAINGVAGSASESVPVIHVTGAPATRAQGARMLIHHTLGDGKFDHFLKINAEISCAAALLTPENALTEIDRVLVEALYHKKPGYIALPTDLAEAAAHPPAGPLQLRQPELSKPSLAAFVEAAKAKISAAKKPAVMVGHLVERHQLGTTTDGFLRTSKLPFTLASLGKGAVEENVPNCLGTYFPGEVECASKSAMDDSDACILLGVQLTDGVTGNFRHKFELQNVIDVQPYYAKVGDHLYPQIPMKDALAALEAICAPLASKSPTYPAYEVFAGSKAKTLDTQHLWAEIQAGLQPRDIVVVDLGTSAFSSLLLRLPTGGKYFCQHMWASIGYSIPAALGAQIADPTRRVVSITGDGAAQMTIQEICTFATHQLHPVMFLINNDGYTIERYIRGENAIYNDIAPWNWLGLAQAFCPKANLVTKRIDQVGEVRAALQATTRTSLSFYEVMVGRMEGPVRSVVPLPLMAHPK